MEPTTRRSVVLRLRHLDEQAALTASYGWISNHCEPPPPPGIPLRAERSTAQAGERGGDEIGVQGAELAHGLDAASTLAHERQLNSRSGEPSEVEPTR